MLEPVIEYQESRSTTQSSPITLQMLSSWIHMLLLLNAFSLISFTKAFGHCKFHKLNRNDRLFVQSRRSLSSSTSHRMSHTSDEDSDQMIMNVLCLHGKGNNGETFQNTLSPLEEKLQSQATEVNLKFQFDYLDAPFVMNHQSSENEREWWRLPPGVRSFHAKEYQGFDRSKSLVWNAVQSKKYDFILGHSQGAILLSGLMTSKDWNVDYVKGYIFNGAAWPNPFEDQMNEFRDKEHSSLNQSKFLFIIGDADTINPPESAMKVRNVFASCSISSDLKHNVETIHHPGGHAVPVKDEKALQSMTDWILNVALT